ncbi:hypothetical protein LJE86_01615 [bacterium BMS3Abin03]|jgi:hypothetical protein|nr:hypothetical protein [bacterium BMS3Abin03]MCG6959542.1 hypothetical protein [bacterium BMS3Abin03]
MKPGNILSLIFLSFVLVLFVCSFSFGQADSSSVTKLTLTDESEISGYVIEETDSLVLFRTISGSRMEINPATIEERKILKGEFVDNHFVRYDPNRTRLFFAPTARTIPVGKGYFSSYEIIFPMLAVGITDFITVSGGMSLIPGADQQMVYLGPKVRFYENENFSLGGGLIYAHFNENSFGIAYGLTTIGSQMEAVTIGIGWGHENWEPSDKPFILLGGEVQVSNSFKFITENWILPETVIVSAGIRFFGDNLAADFAFLRPLDEEMDGFPFIPWIGFVYNF